MAIQLKQSRQYRIPSVIALIPQVLYGISAVTSVVPSLDEKDVTLMFSGTGPILMPWFPSWLNAPEQYTGKELFVVGEYWAPDSATLHRYLDTMGDRVPIFDVPLHYNPQYPTKKQSVFKTCRFC